ncbi:hypothetical protein BC834DRAFT_901295 [Gloeopeniophorella convolvens]|nr:hypothetical protein BC834DRAFT_901295 [Gloeopeniophorella convolvens]
MLASSNSSPSEQLLNISYGLSVFPFAILYYDYALTLGQEVDYFWRGGHSSRWVSYMFFLNRYVSVLGCLPRLVFLFLTMGRLVATSPGSQEVHAPSHSLTHLCKYSLLYGQGHDLLLLYSAALLSFMRVYALYNRSRVIMALFISIAVIGSVAFFWAVVPADQHPLEDHTLRCADFLLTDDGGNRMSLPWGSLLVFDTIVFALTLCKTKKIRKKEGFIRVVLRDGTMYFGILFFVNISNILMLRLGPPLLKASLTTFGSVISATLMSRLMLNLHSIPRQRTESTLCLTEDLRVPVITVEDSEPGKFGDDIRTEWA